MALSVKFEHYAATAAVSPHGCWAALFLLVLSGCQSWTFTRDSELLVSSGKAETVETHAFALAEGQGMVGTLAAVDSQRDDTLSDLARHFGLGFTDITIANPGLEPWALADNQPVLLPVQFILPEAPRKGVVLNLANMRMFYYPRDQRVLTFPVGIGRDGWNTPLGLTKIVAKKANPAWTVPQSIHREHRLLGDPLPKVIPSGPDNPLGNYAMPLGFTGYLIHGTNKPYGIGMQVSHGCVQLYPEDVEVLFGQVSVGTPVRIVHQPYLAAWDRDMLYLEAHGPLEKWRGQDKKLQADARARLKKLAEEKNAVVDWVRVDAVLNRADGIPTPVLLDGPDLVALAADALKVRRPERLYGQPEVGELTDGDWSVVIGSLEGEMDAQKLAAMLNHLGPQIPARKVEKDGVFQVVAGPFKSAKETRIMAKRIKSSFDLEATPIKPLANR
ncbi:L,D-transpeptidase family protein [Methylomonas sp. SURF-2]|uniref:L,D-transpeptidase family protein n=1 Tax=Methylomonas subterranea TaxID=2952225 RepID=A0ABT1TBB4_9GAMM|nr:L,D-transpeptidase family protein [Methylomonas sp. SURF-2]MCQ8102757.1 L,D-transpeptidase family protein [Methylomonas sp. SURF-2]